MLKDMKNKNNNFRGNMKIEDSSNNKYLVTTDKWFVAPDGKTYTAAWGDIKIMPDSFLGIKTNRNATNWYVKIGSETKHIIIAGCQIHYAIKSPNKPNIKIGYTWDIASMNKKLKQVEEFKIPTKIYIAE